MNIDGPLIIAVSTEDNSLNHQLHISFKPEFIQLLVPQRVQSIQSYRQKLDESLQALALENPDRLGIQTVLQICENLETYIANDDIDLKETIVIEIEQNMKISNLLNTSRLIN